jgi:hypothetical protein
VTSPARADERSEPSAWSPHAVAPSEDGHEPEKAGARPLGPAYGWMLGIPDGASIALGAVSFGVAVGAKSSDAWLPLAGAAVGTYALGAPIVHMAHGYPLRGLADLGIRVGAPLLLGAAGTGLICASDRGACSGLGLAWASVFGFGIGGGVGAISAMLVEHFVIPSDRSPRWTARWDGKPIVRPEVSALPGGGTVGVGGAF